jgi:hypothetical protein
MARRSPLLSSPHRRGPASGSIANPNAAAPCASARPPTPLPLQNPLQRTLAFARAEPLQRRTPAPFKHHITARTITRMAEKIFLLGSMVMTLARLPRHPPVVGTARLVAGSVRFVVGVSAGHSPTAGTAACSSTATTAGLVADTPRCNNVPSDASAENSSRIPSVNTAGSAAVLSLSSFLGFVDFFEKLKDLDWGSWERSLPEGSSLGAGMPLLSEAPFILSL